MTYRRGADRFVKAHEHWTGTNNNQQVRFMPAGPLAGDTIAVEPTETAPFGYCYQPARMLTHRKQAVLF